jgi:hypothetical protein
MRDDKWLFQKLDEIWDGHFSDIPQNNDVLVKFGRKARQRLGSIKQETKSVRDLADKNRKTIIIINGLFKDIKVPEYVVTATIAHEMCHYTHGFSSPLEQRHPHPHYGGVVTKEMKERGFGKELKMQKKWLKEVWPEYLKEKMPVKSRQRRRKRRIIMKWI